MRPKHLLVITVEFKITSIVPCVGLKFWVIISDGNLYQGHGVMAQHVGLHPKTFSAGRLLQLRNSPHRVTTRYNNRRNFY